MRGMLLLMLAKMFSHTYDVFASLMLCVCYVQDMFRRLGDGPPVLRRLRCMHRVFLSTQDLLFLVCQTQDHMLLTLLGFMVAPKAF